jgi:hypothetical protein
MTLRSALRAGLALLPRHIFWYPFVRSSVKPRAIERLHGLSKLKKKTCNDLIGDRTRDLTACIIVPQPTMLPRAIYNAEYRSQ